MPVTAVQVSDTHISPTHTYFSDNWGVFVAEMRATPPDLLIHTGDFSFNGPLEKRELHYARDAAISIGSPTLTIPGNHDIGAPGTGPRAKKPITEDRIRNWRTYFGTDCFVRDIEDWRLIGLNSEILGSGLASEESQWSYLEDSCSNADGRKLGVFIHRPLFEKTIDEEASRWSMHPAPRARLMDRLKAFKVQFVASGHLHRYRYISFEGMDLVWCPTTAFVTPSTKNDGAVRRVGYLKWTFDGSSVRHEFVEPTGFINHDMSWKKRHAETQLAAAE